MASALKKLFKTSERHHSDEGGGRGGGRRRKNGAAGRGNNDSPTHHHSAALRFFGHCSGPRLPRRDANKISPEDGAASKSGSSCGAGGACNNNNNNNSTQTPTNTGTPTGSLKHNSPGRSVRFKSSRSSKTSPITGSPQAMMSESVFKHSQTVRTRRLMKEYQEITKHSRSMEKPPFLVELVEDNLFEWNIKLYQIDPESEFYSDMQEAGIRYVLLNMVFPDNFPFSPPFMRVISPHVEKGFVMEGGAICMELLTPRGWASAYTVEAVVMQFAAGLVKGQGRIARKCKSGKEFSRKSAEASFRSLVKTHERYGWVTPPLADG